MIEKLNLETLKQSDFESQFANPELIKTAGGEAEVVDLKPENLEHEVPTFLAPGWAYTRETYKPALKKIFESGRRTVTVDHPRTGGVSSLDFEHQNLDEKYPKDEVRKALTIIDALKAKDIEQTDMIMHSEAAINGLIAATLEPKRFRNLILCMPAGLIGEDSFPRLVNGFFKQFKRAKSLENFPVTETEKQVKKEAVTGGLKYFWKNPVRGLNEAFAIADTQVKEMIKKLHDEGVGIVIMATIDDTIFPISEMQKNVEAGSIDGFLALKGGHSEIAEHPEQYMKAALDMLDKLEEKQRDKK